MKYMLDTNIIIYAVNNRPEAVMRRFRRYRPEDLFLSAITLAELEYGVCNSSRPDQNRMALMLFLSNIDIIPFDANASREYGSIRHELKTKGELIGSNDLLIAAHAKSLGMTLITNNQKEFARVKGLRIKNWT